jgi:hypothetical protein
MKTAQNKSDDVSLVTELEQQQLKQAKLIKATVKRWITSGIIEREALITYLQRLSPGPQIVDVNPRRNQNDDYIIQNQITEGMMSV